MSPQLKTLVCKRMIQIALEKDESAREMCIELFKDLYMTEILSKEQIRRGFDLVCIDMDDILIDIPFAINHLFQMVDGMVFTAKLFGESFLYRIPDALLDAKVYLLLTPSAKHTLIPKLPKTSLLYEQGKCKEDFLLMGKEAIVTRDFEPLYSYFDSHPNFKPLHCLFVRKVLCSATGRLLKAALTPTMMRRKLALDSFNTAGNLYHSLPPAIPTPSTNSYMHS